MIKNTNNKRPKKFFVLGGKWWDSVNGNTYCNAKIMDINGNISYSGYEYGYNDYYLQAAKNFLVKKYGENIKIFDMGNFYTKKSIIKNNLF